MRRRQKFAEAARRSPPPPKMEKTPHDMYLERFGKRPHHKLKPETILSRLEADTP